MATAVEAARSEQVGEHRDERSRREEAEARDRSAPRRTDRIARVGAHGIRVIAVELAGGEHARGLRGRVGLGHATGAVDQRQLVRVDVEMREGGLRGGVGAGCLEQFALRAHRDVLPRSHRQGAGQQARDTGEQHGHRRHAGRADAEHEGEVRDQPVVGAEHGGAEAAGRTSATAGREPAHHLPVDALVGRHGLGRVRLALVRRSGFCALRQGEHEERPESAGEDEQDAGAQLRARPPASSPSRSSQCASCRPSASARPSRIAFSSPVLRSASSR